MQRCTLQLSFLQKKRKKKRRKNPTPFSFPSNGFKNHSFTFTYILLAEENDDSLYFQFYCTMLKVTYQTPRILFTTIMATSQTTYSITVIIMRRTTVLNELEGLTSLSPTVAIIEWLRKNIKENKCMVFPPITLPALHTFHFRILLGWMWFPHTQQLLVNSSTLNLSATT